MNATNRLDLLISDFYKTSPSTTSKDVSQGTAVERPSRLILSERDLYPSAITATVPLPPRRDSSSLKHHRRRYQIAPSDPPLLNSSTLDDLFRALTLECEKCLAAASTYQSKTYGQMLVQPSSKTQTAVESNDDDYENLQPAKPITKTHSPLKTSIEVMSPIKRHVVSITVSSKVSSSQLASPTKTIPPPPLPPAICHSSEEDTTNLSSSSTNRKRRRRARKHITASTTSIRSSSSSPERNEKKPTVSKRSFSTDHRSKNSSDNPSHFSKQQTRRPPRRDVSLQHYRTDHQHSSPLSVLLTSTKETSDFLDNSSHRQQRRSRLESVNQKSSTLLDRMHQQFYRPLSTTRNKTKHNNNNNIPVHRIPFYPVY